MSEYETPSLPEGYYFKVDSCSLYAQYGRVRVRLVRKRKWWFDDTIAYEEEVIPNKCSVSRAMRHQADKLKNIIAAKRLHGDYPPKKL